MLDQSNLKNKAVHVVPPEAWTHPHDVKNCERCGQVLTPPAVVGVHWREDGTASVYNAKDQEVHEYSGTHAVTLAKLKAKNIEWGRLPFVVGEPNLNPPVAKKA